MILGGVAFAIDWIIGFWLDFARMRAGPYRETVREKAPDHAALKTRSGDSATRGQTRRDDIAADAGGCQENLADSAQQGRNSYPGTNPVSSPEGFSDTMAYLAKDAAKSSKESMPACIEGYHKNEHPAALETPRRSRLGILRSGNLLKSKHKGSQNLEIPQSSENIDGDPLRLPDGFTHSSRIPDEVQSPRRPLNTIPEDGSIHDWGISETDYVSEHFDGEFPDPDPDLICSDDSYEDWSGVGDD